MLPATEIHPVSDNAVSIVFCADENYIIPLVASIQSIVDNISEREREREL
ncbi:MAG: hypothetical protein J1E80_00355 [Desulfovibrionaceae bacterium]|nr:hypothetical protein [Desulfovibrionaceae bacterium]